MFEGLKTILGINGKKQETKSSYFDRFMEQTEPAPKYTMNDAIAETIEREKQRAAKAKEYRQTLQKAAEKNKYQRMFWDSVRGEVWKPTPRE
jgi:hypothetical protein